MEMELKKVALITGCSEPLSLGAALSRDLLKRGWRVFATARKLETLEDLENQGCDVLELDVVSNKSIASAVAKLSELTGGRLDLLVNNAGVAGLAPLLDQDVTRIQALYDINVFGPIRMLQACSELLIRTASVTAQGKATVLNISSTARYMPPWQGAYGSSKVPAIANISETMRMELAPLGIKVILGNLNGFKTPMMLGQKSFPLKRGEIEQDSSKSHYPNFDQVDTELHTRFAPKTPPEVVANLLVNAVERKGTPPSIVWAGDAIPFYRYIFLNLPAWLIWKAWNKMAGVSDINFVKELPNAKADQDD